MQKRLGVDQAHMKMLSNFYYCYSFVLASFTFFDLSDSDLAFKMQIKCLFLRWLFITFSIVPSYPLGYTHHSHHQLYPQLLLAYIFVSVMRL